MPRKKHNVHYIYKTTCIVTEKYYIGIHSTNNIYDGYLGSGKRLRYSIRKYGKENHIKEILEFFTSREETEKRECVLINENINNSNCLNLTNGGTGFKKKHTQKTKIKISKSLSGKTYNELYDNPEIEKEKRKVSVKKHWDSLTEEEKKKRIDKMTIKMKEFFKTNHSKRFGKPAPQQFKPILQFTKYGEFIREWDSTKTASINLKISPSSISRNLNGINKTSGNFIFKFKL